MLGIYKKGQGSTARWITAASMLGLAAWGVYELEDSAASWTMFIGRDLFGVPMSWIPALVAAIGAAILTGFVINWPRFVDYLIMSEAELRKVSWPTRGELKRQTQIVIITILFFGAILFIADLIFALGAKQIFKI